MILLVLALICLGGAAFMIGQLVTAPAQERERFFKRIASYGHEKQRVLKPTEESLKVRSRCP